MPSQVASLQGPQGFKEQAMVTAQPPSHLSGCSVQQHDFADNHFDVQSAQLCSAMRLLHPRWQQTCFM